MRDVLSAEELAAVTARSDLRAAWLLCCNLLIMAAAFALAARWPNPLTLLLAVALLGARQLGFGILMHEAGHRLLFRSRAVNEWVGTWLIAPPTFGNMAAYMRGHLEHHRLAGTEQDPDLANYRDYPISRSRLRRKLWRDISGQTGWKTLKRIGLGLRHLPRLDAETRASLLRGVGFNLLLFLLLLALGQGWLYLLWVLAFLCVNPLVSRIRQVGEHAAVPDRLAADPRLNTRTIVPSFLARLFICPHQVSYHLEHHLLPSVPIYRLRRLHELLRSRGYYGEVDFPRGYLPLLRAVTVPG
ncbi:MAG: fatty acid desaturase family protein [Gammaproteobacteria bacterium]|nr:fatty acid desaturase family protein [Gammaproteobacteria bacterium]